MRCAIYIIIIFWNICNAQSQITKGSDAYIGSLLKRANAVYNANPDSSYYYSGLAFRYALKNKFDVGMAEALRTQAKSDILKGDVEQALKKLRNAIVVFEKHDLLEHVAKCYSLMSIAVGKVHNDTGAVSYMLKAVRIYEKSGDYSGLSSTMVNLANSYTKINEYDKALEVLHESRLFFEAGSREWFYYYINAGIIYKYKKRYKQAALQFDSCLAISQRYNMIDAHITALTDIANLLVETKKYQEAETHYLKALSMSRYNKLPIEESEALEGLQLCYERKGNYKEAYFCQNRFKTIKDSLFNIEKMKNINNIEVRLKVSEKEKTIAIQRLAMEEGELQRLSGVKRQQYLAVAIIFLLSISFFTYFTYLRVKKQKNEAELQKARAEKLNQLNQKIFAVIAHDFKSPLITLNMLLDVMENSQISKEDMSQYSADVRNQIIQSGQILENLLNWAKSELNLRGTGDVISEPKQVASEIIKELGHMAQRKQIGLVNELKEGSNMKLPPDILKIIIRNLASNAIKFSRSGQEVMIGSDEQNVIYVKDNGVGINDKEANLLFSGTIKSKLGTFNETGFGLGLYITYELVSKFGGKLWVEKNQPEGSVFKFTV